MAKQQRTAHGVLQCVVPQQTAKAWNAARGEGGYGEEVWGALCGRYESPDDRNRWGIFYIDLYSNVLMLCHEVPTWRRCVRCRRVKEVDWSTCLPRHVMPVVAAVHLGRSVCAVLGVW